MGEMQNSEKYIVKCDVYDMLDLVLDMSLMSNVVYIDASKIRLIAFLILYNIICCKNQMRKNVNIIGKRFHSPNISIRYLSINSMPFFVEITKATIRKSH